MSLIPSGFAKSAAAAGFYSHPIEQSLRFNDDDSAYLSWTPASAGNRKTWTWSGWVKRGNLGVAQSFLGTRGSSPSNSNTLQFGFNSSNQFELGLETAYFLISSSVYRDTSSWYHIVFTLDTTQATASDRVKVYINGEEVTAWGTDSRSSISQNSDLGIGISGQMIQLGSLISNSWYVDGYLAEVHFIDGTALDASSFGETKSGVWIPKAYAGSYGTNGFYLDFGNSGSIGADVSGNGNNFTANNLAATDVVLDSPTNNFATLSVLDDSPVNKGTFSEGNLKFLGSSAGYFQGGQVGTLYATGKIYYEVTITIHNQDYFYFGFAPDTYHPSKVSSADAVNTRPGKSDYGVIFDPSYNLVYYDGSSTTAFSTNFSVGDVLMLAMDTTTGKAWIGVNGTWLGSGNPSTDSNPYVTLSNGLDSAWTAAIGCYYITTEAVCNFGQDSSFAGNKTAQGNTDDNGYGDFYYAPPTGYLALCTANLTVPDAMNPALDNSPQDYFNTVLYTGTGTTNAVTGVGFQPDWIWWKSRSAATSHATVNAVTGIKGALSSNNTSAEYTEGTDNGLMSFDSDGFTVKNDGNYTAYNQSGSSIAAWCWKANGSGVSNTDGSITSTVSANTDAGFSIVSYTGNNTIGATVGHGLSQAPEMIIIKNRDNAATNWTVYHAGNTSQPETERLKLNSAAATLDVNYWNDTAPTSSVFTLYSGSGVNEAENLIAYCWHSVEGFSKFGSYTGNGSTDGTFVYTGFRPAFVMMKYTSGDSGNWIMYDAARDEYNLAYKRLGANVSDSENQNDTNLGVSTTLGIDMLSNGFKLRTTGVNHNASGGTYIYMAFAELPTKFCASMAR